MINSLIIPPLLALVFSPLLAGIINRTKAFFAGRKGPPMLQRYYDLYRLFRKGYKISSAVSFIFFISPVIIFTLSLASAVLVPVFSFLKALSFQGDFILLFYLLALSRFFLIISALDTGSSFEGMGASREAFFSALAEPVIFISVLTVLRLHGTVSFSDALVSGLSCNPVILLITAVSFFIIMLAENSRIPFDDPNTHLELTMIHEVMILDNSGPDLALLEYASSIKLWIFSLVISRIVLSPLALSAGAETASVFVLIFIISIAAGIAESLLARVSMLKVPKLIISAGITAFLAYFLSFSNIYIW